MVSGIASGKRPNYELQERYANYEPLGPIERCRECGGRGYMPRRLCRVRKPLATEEQRLIALRRTGRQESLRRLLDELAKARPNGPGG